MGIPGSYGSLSACACEAELTPWVVCVLGRTDALWSRSDDCDRMRSSEGRLDGADGCCGAPRASSWSDGPADESDGGGSNREDRVVRCLRRVAKDRCWVDDEGFVHAFAIAGRHLLERMPRRAAVDGRRNIHDAAAAAAATIATDTIPTQQHDGPAGKK